MHTSSTPPPPPSSTSSGSTTSATQSNASSHHVRRAARALGPTPDARHIRSHSTQTSSTPHPQQHLKPPTSQKDHRQRSNTVSAPTTSPEQEQQAMNCPICGVMAPSLFALNDHLDNTHFSNNNGATAAAVMKQNRSAENKQPSVASRYAAQDDLGEVKETILGFFFGGGGGANGKSKQLEQQQQRDSPHGHGRAQETPVTKEHWQQYRPGTRCGVPACDIAPEPSTLEHCRCCGRIMCLQHCHKKLRLSTTAQPVSSGGVLSKVCGECYERSFLQSATAAVGVTRDLMPGFALLRRKARSGALLEGNRMEKRLEKLSLIHGSDAYQGGPGPMNQRQKQRLQQAEQTVVRWEEDSAVTSCPFCLKSFGLLSSRRHHCRLCGRIICHRPTCSTHLLTPLLDLSSNTGGFTAERTAQIRACRECAHVVDRQQRRAQGAGTLAQEMLLRMYLVLCQQMRKVEETLPVFNMLALKHHEDGMGADLARAARIRRQLTGAFGELDAVSKGIEQLPCGSMTDARLHSAVRRMVAQYLQIHMFPLTMLPSKPTPKSTVTPQQQQQQQKGVMGLGLSSTDADVARASSSVSVRSTDAGSVVVVNGVVEAAVFDPSPSPSLSLDTATPAAKSLVGAMGGTASNLATSLLSYVIPPRTTLTTTTAISRKDTTSSPSNIITTGQSTPNTLDPEREARIVSMPLSEKLASLDILRDQRQRVQGYILEARREKRSDDVVYLQSSLGDLDIELSLIEKNL